MSLSLSLARQSAARTVLGEWYSLSLAFVSLERAAVEKAGEQISNKTFNLIYSFYVTFFLLGSQALASFFFIRKFM